MSNEQNSVDFLSTPQYSETNTGTLFPNTQRTKDTHPNCRGKANIEGKWYWVSGWNKIQANSTSRFVSLAYTAMTDEDVEKYVTNRNQEQQEPAPVPNPELAPQQSEEDVKKQVMAENTEEDKVF